MTAEIALLNKHAVALAADSAVTVTGTSGNKIYNAANKVFALSKWNPVGIMVYGNAEYMGVPWETIVKVYREQLNRRVFATLQGAYDDFIQYLGSNDSMFGESAQEEHVIEVAREKFHQIREEIRTRVDAVTKVGTVLDDDQVKSIQSDIIQEYLGLIAGSKFVATMDEAHEGVVRALFGPLIDQGIEAIFKKLPLSEVDLAALRDIVVFWLTREKFPSGTSGVVIAGFGADEHFPSLRSATIQARIAGRLKYAPFEETEISNDNGAAVVPFAQTDAVRLFVEGIDPRHAVFSVRLAAKKFDDFMSEILDSLKMNEGDAKAAKENWEKLAERHLRDFVERAKAARTEKYVSPLIDVIAALPKDELAAVAEALVNITSLRRKISMDAETVGGPIDVAVISKGDGLIWIKRKHYFDPHLNQNFFETYFRRSQQEG
jgi:hypothetical protein